MVQSKMHIPAAYIGLQMTGYFVFNALPTLSFCLLSPVYIFVCSVSLYVEHSINKQTDTDV